MVRKEYPGRGNSVLCPVAGAGVSSERVRKANVARAESADRTCRELRMGPLAGLHYIGPRGDLVFIWRMLGRQGRVSNTKALLRSVPQRVSDVERFGQAGLVKGWGQQPHLKGGI